MTKENRSEHMSSLSKELAMRQAHILPKNGMAAIILALKYEEVNEGAIPLHIN